MDGPNDHDLLIELNTTVRLMYDDWQKWRLELLKTLSDNEVRVRRAEDWITENKLKIEGNYKRITDLEAYTEDLSVFEANKLISWLRNFKTRIGVYATIWTFVWSALIVLFEAWILKGR